jgi:hypothetical protein
VIVHSTGATIATSQVTPSTLMTGNFQLTLRGTSSGNIAFNVDEPTLESTIETFLGTGPVTVSRVGPDLTNGYTWRVTFTATSTNYDVPQMR